jgi:hypothetical protein
MCECEPKLFWAYAKKVSGIVGWFSCWSSLRKSEPWEEYISRGKNTSAVENIKLWKDKVCSNKNKKKQWRRMLERIKYVPVCHQIVYKWMRRTSCLKSILGRTRNLLLVWVSEDKNICPVLCCYFQLMSILRGFVTTSLIHIVNWCRGLGLYIYSLEIGSSCSAICDRNLDS